MSITTKILAYLKDGNSITPIESLDMFGCFRLAARIHNLKSQGHDISTTMIINGKKKWAEYKLVPKKGQGNLF